MTENFRGMQHVWQRVEDKAKDMHCIALSSISKEMTASRE
jgi:hypothetical protein